MLGFEDEVMKLDDLDETPPAGFTFPLVFTWTLPPLPDPPDLLVLATELAGIGASSCRSRSRRSTHIQRDRRSGAIALDGCLPAIDLSDVYLNNDHTVAANLERCKHVSLYLLERAKDWLGDL